MTRKYGDLMTTPIDPGLGLGQPEPEPEPDPEASRSSQRRPPRQALFVALIALGAVLIIGGATALVMELTRPPSAAEAAAALQREIATRWERLPAGKIFPAAIRYQDSDGNSMVAHLVGIAPPASCRAALEPAGYELVRGLGCATILRATYVDASGALATTVGVAVLRSPVEARRAANIAPSLVPSDGLHAVRFGGTVADQFGDAARGADGGVAGGPYFFLYTTGFTDGQPSTAAAQRRADLESFGAGVDAALRVVLTGHGKPCAMKDITC
jgi:hypothetical protein